MRRLKEVWLPKANPTRIIVHWTAGTYMVSQSDLDSYHFIVDGDLKVHRGRYSVADNDSTADGRYAPHVASLNTGSIGITACCMGGASTGKAGKWPLLEAQWKVLAEIAADLCEYYKIPVKPDSVLQHGEVEKEFGINQGGKWDICWLPFAPSKSSSQVCAEFRTMVSANLEKASPGDTIKVTLDGELISTGFNIGGVTMSPVRQIAEALGCTVSYNSSTKEVILKRKEEKK